MLQLHIDGQRVNLPEGFSTEYYVKNPFFSNEGDYTLDIELDLTDPVNAAVYHFADRYDRVKRETRREAILQDETGTLLKGQEVVLEVREGKAKVQIVGGVSELNYIISNRKLQELDLWTSFDSDEVVYVPVCGFNNAPHADFGLMDSSQYETEDGVRVLKWSIANRPSWNSQTGELVMSHDCPQPYIWAIVNRVVTALGFAVGTNVIQSDTRYSRMIMIHAIRSRYIADMLPKWTVSEFLDEIQKFFNVIIDVDKTSRTVNILHAHDFFDIHGQQEISLHDVVNGVEKQFDQQSEMTMVDYAAVHYALTDKMSNKYAALSPSLVRVCESRAAQSMSTSDPYHKNYYAGMWKDMEGNESFLNADEPTSNIERAFGQRIIYHDTFIGEQRHFVFWAVEDNYCAMKMVNMFGPKTTPNPSATDVELRIVPVRMVSSPIVGNSSHWWQYPLPAVDGEASSYHEVKWGNNLQTEATDNINDDIKSGYDESEDNRADVLFAAFYLGELDIDWEDSSSAVPSGIKVPVASPDYMVQLHRRRDVFSTYGSTMGEDRFWKCSRNVVLGSSRLTMAINGVRGMDAYTYSKNPLVDTSVEYTFRFRCTVMPDVRQVFLIGNRRYYCKDLKYDVRSGQRSEVVEGRFLPIVEPGSGESGESVFYVEYSLSRVVVEHRVLSVDAGQPLEVSMKLESGGSASATVQCVVLMGDTDITQTAFISSGRTAVVRITSVTSDVVIRAWRG